MSDDLGGGRFHEYVDLMPRRIYLVPIYRLIADE